MTLRLGDIGLLIFIAGFGILAAGISGQGSASFGGVVFIGPFPIAFGSGPGGPDLALASVLMGVAMLVLLLVWSMRLRSGKLG